MICWSCRVHCRLFLLCHRQRGCHLAPGDLTVQLGDASVRQDLLAPAKTDGKNGKDGLPSLGKPDSSTRYGALHHEDGHVDETPAESNESAQTESTDTRDPNRPRGIEVASRCREPTLLDDPAEEPHGGELVHGRTLLYPIR